MDSIKLKVKCFVGFIFVAIGLVFLPSISQAEAFNKGSTVATLGIGSGQLFRESYLIFGAGVGYYVADGLEVGLEVDYWSGGNPTVYELTPRLTYIYDNGAQIKPYLGVFINRTYIEDRPDSDAYGYRAGVLMKAGRSVYVGFGLVNTELQDCNDTPFFSCSETYTEASIIFSL